MKYLFSDLTLKKIYKVRDIFLEFKGKNSETLNIKEIIKMFQSNNIEVSKEEIKNLFFPLKSNKKSEESLDLNFFEFMSFATSTESDERFRILMRNVKEKIFDKKKEEIKNESNNYDKKKSNEINEENSFFPMNFNLLLDYFNMNRKDRLKTDQIELIIKKIDDYMLKEKFIDTIRSTESKKNTRNLQSLKEEINIPELLDIYYELMKPRRAKDINLEIIHGKIPNLIEKTESFHSELEMNKRKSSLCSFVKQSTMNLNSYKSTNLREDKNFISDANKISSMKINEILPILNKTNHNYPDIQHTHSNSITKSRNRSSRKLLFPSKNNNGFVEENIPADIVRTLNLSNTKDRDGTIFTFGRMCSRRIENQNLHKK